MTLHNDVIATLGAVVETLIPADQTPGAEAAWASGFVATWVARDPDEAPRLAALAAAVDAAALRMHALPFVQLAVDQREPVLASLHPTLADHPELSTESSEQRRLLRHLMTGFIASDHLDVREAPFVLISRLVSAADLAGDLAMDRRLAMNVGTGDYARVWAAAGYRVPPGAPQRIEDVVRAPDDDD